MFCCINNLANIYASTGRLVLSFFLFFFCYFSTEPRISRIYDILLPSQIESFTFLFESSQIRSLVSKINVSNFQIIKGLVLAID